MPGSPGIDAALLGPPDMIRGLSSALFIPGSLP